MNLRSLAKHENGRISLDMALSSNRHSRACGNPDLFRRTDLDIRFRGYDGLPAPSLFWSPPALRIFKEDTKTTKGPNFGVQPSWSSCPSW